MTQTEAPGYVVADRLRQLFRDVLDAQGAVGGLAEKEVEHLAERFRPVVAGVVDLLPQTARAEFAADTAAHAEFAERATAGDEPPDDPWAQARVVATPCKCGCGRSVVEPGDDMAPEHLGGPAA